MNPLNNLADRFKRVSVGVLLIDVVGVLALPRLFRRCCPHLIQAGSRQACWCCCKWQQQPSVSFRNGCKAQIRSCRIQPKALMSAAEHRDP
eukprot:353182-Chlamydomonas_euryale.AAC.64